MRLSTFLIAIVCLFATPSSFSQSTGGIKGTVTLAERDLSLHHVTIVISQLRRSVETDESGTFEFKNVPAGTYDLVASSPGLSSLLQTITVTEGQTAAADFKLKISGITAEVTVTATGREQTAFESFQIVNTLDSFQLAEKSAASVGEVLDNQPGVAKRSFGPGTARPVIRGFDGDRVLIMQDGVRTGTLSSQSGDHGEPIDVMSIERLEVVKGPATLLYGSNAIGGVVNAVSRHFQMKETSQAGLRGYLTGTGGSNNAHGAASGGFEYGSNNWLLWGNGGNQKTRDYKAGGGETIVNAGSRLSSGGAGVGWFGDNAFTSVGYNYEDGIYGIPLDPNDAEEITRLDFFRRNARISGGVRNVGAVGGVRFNLNYSGWNHKELNFAEDPFEVATTFNNKQYTYEFNVDQRRTNRLTGTIGFYGMHRNYATAGEEAIAPPVKANVNAVFGLEEVSFERFKLQFGGRIESTRYTPDGAPNTSFTGFSGAAGVHIPTWKGGAFVTNYTHSYRAPALEELYNNGPHPGNLAFEVGDVDLQHESSDGIDVSVRHSSERFRAEASLFYYDLRNYVFLFLTGDEIDGFNEALYSQGNSRYSGTELDFKAGVHQNVWLELGFDYVSAELKASKTPLPRIPPARGRIGIEGQYKGLSIKPELVIARNQSRVFTLEDPTAGYTAFNINVSYTIPTQHMSHHFAFNAFNLGDRLYRNHVSFIKDLAPEIGRGVRVTYAVRFF